MIIHYTPEEIREKEEIENKYNKLLKEAEKLVEKLEPKGKPNTEKYFEGLDPLTDPKKWDQAVKKEERNLTAWIESGGPEWNEARNHYFMLQDSFVDELNRFTKKCEQRQFAELGQDPKKIEEDFKVQVQETIENIFNSTKNRIENIANEGGGIYQSNYIINTGAGTWKLNPVTVRQNIIDGLKMYFDFCEVRDGRLGVRLKNYLNDVFVSDTRFASTGNIAIKEDAIKVEPEKYEVVTLINKRPNHLNHFKDKGNNNIWENIGAQQEANGQLVFNFNTVGDKLYDPKTAKEPAPLIISLTFDDDLTVEKRLTPFDKRVYSAIHTLFCEGVNPMSLNQIFYQMGNRYTTRANPGQIKKIKDSILKMRRTRLFVDNSVEVKLTKGGYKEFKTVYGKLVRDEMLLDVSGMELTVSGVNTDAIFAKEEPIIGRFAKERAQITTIPREVLEAPLSMSDQRISIEEYLSTWITTLKNPKATRSNKTSLEKIYLHAEAKGKQRQRAKDKLIVLLDYYKQIKYIKDYSIDNEMLEIKVDIPRAKITKKNKK